MKTSELIGPALDWAVAKCEGQVAQVGKFQGLYLPGMPRHLFSTNWTQGGPIIERKGINSKRDYKLVKGKSVPWWFCQSQPEYGNIIQACKHYTGETLLIAAMRCYVASKLGDEVKIPEELL